MAPVDLRNFLVRDASRGSWLNDSSAFQPNRISLSKENDRVTFRGPIALRMTRTVWRPGAAGGGTPLTNLTNDAVLFVPPNGNYTFTVGPDDLVPLGAPENAVSMFSFEVADGQEGEGSRDWVVNFPERYYAYGDNQAESSSEGPARVYVRGTSPPPGGYQTFPCPQGSTATLIPPPPAELPCDFGVSNMPNIGQFFPSACEPCPPHTYVCIPPGTQPTLSVPVAKGGCVRPRFFNGQFITKEDLETLLNWNRTKMQLHNKAAGQGVVWGFKIAEENSNIVVHSGYGVDCCGNDLVINPPYCVPKATLLRDPLAVNYLEQCELGQPQRMHLLLEYHECPEQPRPVHGDPCTPESNSCEVSRMRETVRLRLVPPRDYEREGPLSAFLKEIEAILTNNPALASLVAPQTHEAGEYVTTNFPYEVRVGLRSHPRITSRIGIYSC